MKIVLIIATLSVCLSGHTQQWQQSKMSDTVFVKPICCGISTATDGDTLYVRMTTCDSLKTALFNANYKLARVKYYLRIAIRNPKQQKFLTSWISRAIK